MKNSILLITLLLLSLVGCNQQKETEKKLDTDLSSEKVKEVNKISYSAGFKYAQALKEMKMDAESQEYFIAGVKDFFKDQDAQTPQLVGQYARMVDKIILENRKKVAEIAKVEGKKFVEEIINSGEYQKTDSGLLYKITKQGKNSKVKSSSFIQFNYEAKKISGEKFETTMNGDPRITPYTGLLKAWQEAVKIAGENSSIEIIAPPELTYGERGALPRIKPGEYLIYSMNFYNVYKTNPRQR